MKPSYLYVYKSPSGKMYVGITNNIDRRWSNHCSSARNIYDDAYNTPFHNAIRLYGEDKIERILLIQTTADTKVLERFYIKTLGTLAPAGYNLTPGGEGFRSGKDHPCYRHDITDDMIREDHSLGLSQDESALKRNCSHPLIIDRRKKLGLISNAPTGTPCQFTLEDVDEMERLWKVERWTMAKIAQKYGIARTYVSKLIHGVKGPRKYQPRKQ